MATEGYAQLTNQVKSKVRNDEPLVFPKRYNVHTSGYVAHLLSKLQWPSLEQRRKEARLTMIYDGVTSMKFSSFLNGDLL